MLNAPVTDGLVMVNEQLRNGKDQADVTLLIAKCAAESNLVTPKGVLELAERNSGSLVTAGFTIIAKLFHSCSAIA